VFFIKLLVIDLIALASGLTICVGLSASVSTPFKKMTIQLNIVVNRFMFIQNRINYLIAFTFFPDSSWHFKRQIVFDEERRLAITASMLCSAPLCVIVKYIVTKTVIIFLSYSVTCFTLLTSVLLHIFDLKIPTINLSKSCPICTLTKLGWLHQSLFLKLKPTDIRTKRYKWNNFNEMNVLL